MIGSYFKDGHQPVFYSLRGNEILSNKSEITFKGTYRFYIQIRYFKQVKPVILYIRFKPLRDM